MKKAGLCVRYDCNNYGSMLQILATQKAIEKMGWQYEIIRYDKQTLLFLIKNITRLFNPYFMRGKIIAYKKNKSIKANPEIQKNNAARLNRFRDYRQKYIGPYSTVFKGEKKLTQATLAYDAVIVGSDQLWTPAGIKSRFYNLLFVPDSVRKIAFATSFGISEVPKNQIKLTKEYLERIEFLSVRETTGADIIKRLTGRDAKVAVDPTLLFNEDEWNSIFPYERQSSEPYIFAYFLGTSEVHRRLVEEFAKEKNLKIITCPHLDEYVESDNEFGDEQRFDVDPVDFLNLIRGAEYICTDSFHGSVFSILNHKKFVTFSRYTDAIRKSKNGRIVSLFSQLGISNRHVTSYDTGISDIIDAEIDYDSVDSVLIGLRNETYEFLDKALNG